jgi:lipid II:glycine glycyltransferase (peptidoglycan interpeptide bridge formation enzyme)
MGGSLQNFYQEAQHKGYPGVLESVIARQLKVPRIVMIRATHKETTIGVTLWYAVGDVGHYHLRAYSDTGYQLRASFALFWFAIEYFGSNGLRWLNLGASRGIANKGVDRLSRFKQEWSTGTRTAYSVLGFYIGKDTRRS